jgi:uncharacterized protein involved in propanediol utilization
MTNVQQSADPVGPASDSPVSGSAYAAAHHGEILQGAFEDADGRLRRGLVTLPLRSRHSFALFVPGSQDGVEVSPPDRLKAARAAALALKHLKVGTPGGRLLVRSNIPIGHGYGSSSADVVASIRAVFDAFSRAAPAEAASRIAVAAEAASDAIAFEETSVLFAHREGRVLDYLGGHLPPLALISFKPPRASPIDTTALARARYTANEIQMLRCALAAVRRAIRQQDPRLLGDAASLSARISQRHLPKMGFERALALVERHGAIGLQVSHSGSLIGIMVDACLPQLNTRLSSLAQDVRSAGFDEVEQLSILAEAKFQ